MGIVSAVGLWPSSWTCICTLCWFRVSGDPLCPAYLHSGFS